jgi:hypothetical protein
MSAAPELRAARWIAGALFAQMLLGPIVNFVLLKPMLDPPGYLANLAAHPASLALAIVLGLAMAALNLGIAIAAWPVLRRGGEAAALWLFALGVACFVSMTMEQAGWLSMGMLGRQHAAAGVEEAAMLANLAGVASTLRASAHVFALMASCALAFVLYLACWQQRRVPRGLAIAGTLAAALAFAAAMHPVFGLPVALNLMPPLGLCHLALIVWLGWRGFRGVA